VQRSAPLSALLRVRTCVAVCVVLSVRAARALLRRALLQPKH
jgi:hypothetical protein